MTGATMTQELRDEIKAALEGYSNDAEHDALVSVAEAFGIEYDPEASYYAESGPVA